MPDKTRKQVLEPILERLQEDGLELLFSDVKALLEVLTILTEDYRLLVGAAEEFNRTSAATSVLTIRATGRAEKAGVLVDRVLVLLERKLDFSLCVLGYSDMPLELILAGIRKEKEEEAFGPDKFEFSEFRTDLELEVDQDLGTEVDSDLEFGPDNLG